MAASSFDRRRVNGPEESFPPIFEDEADLHPVVATGKRLGDRGKKDLRPIYLRTGLISQANGSAYIETGNTKIACAVYAPRQLKNQQYSETGKLNVEVKFAPFSCNRRRAPLRDVEDREISLLVHQSILPAIQLELFPKSTIDVFLTVLENDGLEGCVAAGSIAASTALANAGIEMLGTVVSCAAAVIEQEIWLDPDSRESTAAQGAVVISGLPALGAITNLWQTGGLTPLQAVDCMDECHSRFKAIHDVVAEALLESNQEKQAPELS